MNILIIVHQVIAFPVLNVEYVQYSLAEKTNKQKTDVLKKPNFYNLVAKVLRPWTNIHIFLFTHLNNLK